MYLYSQFDTHDISVRLCIVFDLLLQNTKLQNTVTGVTDSQIGTATYFSEYFNRIAENNPNMKHQKAPNIYLEGRGQ